MNKLKIILITLAIINALYFLWSKVSKSEKFNLKISKTESIKKPIKTQGQITKRDNSTGKTKFFKEIEIKNYISKLNKTIKAQYKEIEDCEKEFDVHFRDLLVMTEEKKLEYIKDPNNLDFILDKFSSINFTTPSSAKVIKEFANPILEKIKITEIYHKPGLQDRVEICEVRGKRDILELLYKSKIKKKAIMIALIDFFENENSTLDYPWILYNQIVELKKLLKNNKIPESKFPKLEQIEKDFKAFNIKINKIMSDYRPKENATWDYQEERFEYEFALKLQSDIKSLLKEIKDDFI